jgi:hypothetical protein
MAFQNPNAPWMTCSCTACMFARTTNPTQHLGAQQQAGLFAPLGNVLQNPNVQMMTCSCTACVLTRAANPGRFAPQQFWGGQQAGYNSAQLSNTLHLSATPSGGDCSFLGPSPPARMGMAANPWVQQGPVLSMEPPHQVVPLFEPYIGATVPQLGSRYPHLIHPSSSFNLLPANYISSRDQHPQRVWPNPERHPLSLGGSFEQENCLDGVHGEENGEERRPTLDLLASVRSWISNMPPSPPVPNAPHSVISEAGETEVPSSEGDSQAEELNSLVAGSGRIDCGIAGSHAAGDHQ